MARRSRLAGGVSRRLGNRGRGDRPRPACRASRPPGARRLARRGALCDRSATVDAGSPDRRGAAGVGTVLRRGDGADRPALVGGPCHRAPGRRRAVRRRRSGRLGPRQRRDLRPADRPARDRAPRPGRPARRWARQGDDGRRQPLGDDTPARFPARLHGLEGPRPVRPGAPDGGGDPGQASRSGRGSPSTRPPTPSNSRRIPGSGPTSPNVWSASSSSSAGRRPAWDGRPCGASAGRSAARATTSSTGWNA